VTAPNLWPEAGEVRGQPLSSQRAWLNLHRPRLSAASVDICKSEQFNRLELLLQQIIYSPLKSFISVSTQRSSWRM